MKKYNSVFIKKEKLEESLGDIPSSWEEAMNVLHIEYCFSTIVWDSSSNEAIAGDLHKGVAIRMDNTTLEIDSKSKGYLLIYKNNVKSIRKSEYVNSITYFFELKGRTIVAVEVSK